MPVYRVPLPQRAGPPAGDASPDPDRLVCGLAASLSSWQADQFTEFLAWHAAGRGGGPPVPLRADHVQYRVTSGGGQSAVGRCLRFASVPASGDGFPGGLLCLAELAEGWAETILAAMRGRGEWLAMSVRGQQYGGDLLVREVSLVDKVGNQADPDALVAGYGPAAATVWELLTASNPFNGGRTTPDDHRL